jgi:ABC-type lipoprotein release transport system permease subunit
MSLGRTTTVFVRIAIRNLVQGGRRSVLLGAAIVMTTTLLVLLASLSAGLEGTLMRSASTLLSGHVNVGGFFKTTSTNAAPLITNVQQLRDTVKDEVPELDFLLDRGRGWGKFISERGSFMVSISAIDVAEERGLFETFRLVEPEPGGQPGRLEDVAQPNTVIIFEGQAERLEVGVGDVITLSAETFGGVTNTLDLRVVAIVEDVGFVSAISSFVPKHVLRDLYQLNDQTSGVVMAYLKDPDRAPEVLTRLEKRLRADGWEVMDHEAQPFWAKFERVAGEDWTGQRLDLTTWKEEASFLMWVLTGFATLRWVLLSGLMILIVIGIMNALWITIRERTGEIGTLRAIGMSRRRVLLMFLTEATVLGLVTTTTGAAIGLGIAWAIDAAQFAVPMEAFQAVLMSDTLHLVPRLGDAVQAVVVITGVTVLAALFPAWKAARMRPVTAIHHIG